MDGAGGVVDTWAVMNLLKEVELRSRHSIRVVVWTNEENRVHALETDGGVFAPVGFGITERNSTYALAEPIVKLLAPLLSKSEACTYRDLLKRPVQVSRAAGGVDTGPLMAEGAAKNLSWTAKSTHGTDAPPLTR